VFTAGTQANRHSPFFYQILHTAGIFPPGAPPTVRMINPKIAGQHSVEQLVDRYDLACRPVRDLLVDYLRERQPGIDYTALVKLAVSLALCFWKDIEAHHPGIGSLCTCRPASPPGGRSASRRGPSASPAAASRSSPASQPATS
jgi:hypothetical protein